ncbi:MAG: hypothetical protein GY798_15605 [Hyphomicrobiales bacterium]|nr:hypothetical protein [Hyphomicrobiales bacterium]
MKAMWKLAIALAIAAMPAGGAWAACEPFMAFSPGDARVVHFSDMDNDGRVSVGDKRVGRKGMFDADGDRIGQYYRVNTVREMIAEGEAGARSTDNVYVLGHGVIFTTRDIAAPRGNFQVAEEVRPSPDIRVQTIVGGLGASSGHEAPWKPRWTERIVNSSST